MTPEQIAEVWPRLAEFAAGMLGGLARSDQRAAGELYVRGLLTDGRRKSMQPMAERLGTDHHRPGIPASIDAVTCRALYGEARGSQPPILGPAQLAMELAAITRHGPPIMSAPCPSPTQPLTPPTLPLTPPAAPAEPQRLTTPAHGRYVLLWFTRLPPDPADTSRASIYDVRLEGPR